MSLATNSSSNDFRFLSSNAVVLDWLSGVENQALKSAFAVIGGILGLSVLAQIAVPLPWTPVPITGQTFGVALIALLWGRTHGLAVFAGYLSLAFVGAPVLAAGKSGLLLGPTFGYLVGMCAAVYLVGGLAESGVAKGFWRTLLCT
ncbi:MAG: biotin transporter BioY, partial [Pseudomonadota bacterium]